MLQSISLYILFSHSGVVSESWTGGVTGIGCNPGKGVLLSCEQPNAAGCMADVCNAGTATQKPQSAALHGTFCRPGMGMASTTSDSGPATPGGRVDAAFAFGEALPCAEEAETLPLITSWHSGELLSTRRGRKMLLMPLEKCRSTALKTHARPWPSMNQSPTLAAAKLYNCAVCTNPVAASRRRAVQHVSRF